MPAWSWRVQSGPERYAAEFSSARERHYKRLACRIAPMLVRRETGSVQPLLPRQRLLAQVPAHRQPQPCEGDCCLICCRLCEVTL